MERRIDFLVPAVCDLWDKYVRNHSRGSCYHLAGWKRVIEESYGHKGIYLMAVEATGHGDKCNDGKIVGILPLVHMRNLFGGSSVVSIPFVDYAGLLADDTKAEALLINYAMKLAKERKAKTLELRQRVALSNFTSSVSLITQTHKVLMELPLPPSSDDLWLSFKAKLRSQIRRPLKEGMNVAIGGIEMIDDFYRIFALNMRDLGSPVHSKRFVHTVADCFPREVKIVIVYRGREAVACGLMFGFKERIENPWASSLQRYSHLSPNMLLYWGMLEYGCREKFGIFSFGRSTPSEGTFKFKQQWGAHSKSLYWHHFGIEKMRQFSVGSIPSCYGIAANVWKKLPVRLTLRIGPMIRRYISL